MNDGADRTAAATESPFAIPPQSPPALWHAAESLPGEQRPTTVRYRVLLWLALAAALSYLVRGAVSVAESTVRGELDLTLAQSGWFMGSFFWSYALFQVPAGGWSQRYGSRRTLACFAMCWSAASVALGLATDFWILIAAQLAMGIAQAGVFPAACNSIAHWMPISRRSTACATLATGMQIGAISASLLSGGLLMMISWRWLFLIYAVPGFVWAIGFWFWFRDRPADSPRVNAAELDLITAHTDAQSEAKQEGPSRTPWWNIASHSALWFLCGQQICRGAGYMFFASWFPTFLQQTRGVSVNNSGILQALVFTGTLVGGLLGGVLTDWIWKRTASLRISRSGVGAAALAGCGLLILAAWFVESVTVAVMLLAAGSVCAALAGPCAFSAAIDMGGRHVPQVFGIMNMTGNLAAAATPILVGALFAWTANWNLVLLLFAAVYLAGALSWLLVDASQRIE
ncbi:MAG: MFS transporter [Aureliella sp.]